MRHQILELDCDTRSPESGEDDPRVTRVDCYDLPSLDLDAVAGLLIGPQVDQEFLTRHQGLIRTYLDGGGTVVFGGHLSRPWLPGSGAFVPLDGRRRRDFRVVEVAAHPLFAGLTADELTFRKGVAGFFARGHHPVPAGGQVLVRLHGGQPCTYLDQVSTGGTILVHATAELRSFVGPRLLDWVLAGTPTGPALAGAAQPPSSQPLASQPPSSQPPSSQSPSSQPLSPWPPAAPGPRAGGGFAAAYSGSSAHLRALTDPAHAEFLRAGLIYLPELAGTDLSGVEGLILPERMHRGLLTEAAPVVLDLLAGGGTVVAFAGGEPVPEFLPGVRWEHRATNFWWWLEEGAALGLRTPDPAHPFFDHVELRNCTWHYHGVLDPPVGAEILVTLPSGEALLYLDRVSTPGTLVVSTLDPLSHFGGYFMPATGRFLAGFLPWLSGLVRPGVLR